MLQRLHVKKMVSTLQKHLFQTLYSTYKFNSAVQSLPKINLTPLAPPDLLARKTCFVRHVETFVGEHSELELKAEIQKLNSRVRINKVAKIPN